MNWLVQRIVSGQAFFSGTASIVTAISCSSSPRPWLSRAAQLLLTVGLLSVAVSSTPLPIWFWGLVSATTLTWIICRHSRFAAISRRIAITSWLAAAAMESTWQLIPQPRLLTSRTLTIIGDSVTAGTGGDEQSVCWPQLLAEQHHIQVQDLSHIGETAESARRRLLPVTVTGEVVLIEIGGNDILGSSTPGEFQTALDGLLTAVAAPGRQLVMFELPLPPFSNKWGAIQRAAAAEHDVLLIPKRVFLSVIARSDSTLDTIHLSQTGHQQMAQIVWNLLQPALPPE